MGEDVKYFIKIGNRYLSWVDENWYETNKKKPAIFNTIVDVKEIVKQLSKHYVYNPFIFEVVNYDYENAREIKLYEKPKDIPFFKKEEKPFTIKCKLRF